LYQFGPKEAVPIMAVAAVMGNLARILAWWREIDWRATFRVFGHCGSGSGGGRQDAADIARACRRHRDRRISDRRDPRPALAHRA